nr:unnamed protein product [Spirometra erinaceieuropaei]
MVVEMKLPVMDALGDGVWVDLDVVGVQEILGLLRLPQPPLHKAATTEEDCFDVVGGASFVQADLLGEHFADGGVVAVEPV